MNNSLFPLPGRDVSNRRGFTHIETWVFDLDNTLYPHDADLWPQIDKQITAYVCAMFGLDGMSARALQKYWYTRYGTTLKALMDEYAINPREFLDMAHDIDRSSLEPNPLLGAAIAALPGRKLVLTNGDRSHAHRTMQQLGINEHFEDVFGIEEAGFTPKPDLRTYEKFLSTHGVDPGRAAMFEDLEKNLRAPHALGMTTVLVTPSGADPHREAWEKDQLTAAPHIDWTTSNLTEFLARTIEP
ncbi:pyrimidine 5'-nucleotidase [Terrarubrum flagellatum]|uniref:pyrimidine 5'-nucleotidase n=1 Tax=Terrirubrum flagellatum TaxID=2895980 RepID=UPI0031452F03